METDHSKNLRDMQIIVILFGICAGLVLTTEIFRPRRIQTIPRGNVRSRQNASVIVTKVRVAPYHCKEGAGQIILVDLKNTGQVPVFYVMVYITTRLSGGLSGGGIWHCAYSGTKGLAPGEDYIAKNKDGYASVFNAWNQPAYSAEAVVHNFNTSLTESDIHE
jgi:hypothetical protein